MLLKYLKNILSASNEYLVVYYNLMWTISYKMGPPLDLYAAML